MGNDRQLTREEREALLVEYQVCQRDSNAIIRTHWIVVSIFVGINTALLGAIAYKLNSNIQWVVFSLGVALITIFICLWLWLDRVNKLVGINESLMRKIEKNLDIAVKEGLKGNGSYPIKGIYIVYILLWVFLIIAAFLPCV
jgi:hypothetical protein